MNTPERRHRLERSAERLLYMLRSGMSDKLIAKECVSIFRHGLVTFEGLAAEIFGKWLIRSVRTSVGQCPDCGDELDERIAGPVICGNCVNSQEISNAVIELELGSDDADPLEFDPDLIDFDPKQ